MADEEHLAKPVTVSLADLETDAVTLDQLEAAFGPSSLGIILVSDLPPHYAALRASLLSYSSYLAALPSDQLDHLESPSTSYLTGWSLGKETLASGRFDTLKGSYYANFPAPPTDLFPAPPSPPPEYTYPHHATYTAPNVWPDEAVLPGFERAFADLVELVADVAALVARACDRYAEAKVPGYTPRTLERVVRTSRTHKARLLHYFPTPAPGPAGPDTNNDNAAAEDDWCATHLDHGCLTGLTSAFYTPSPSPLPSTSTHPLPPLPELPSPPDPSAGLYIHSRTGLAHKVSIPRACLAFQTGEALERMTCGRLRAVPHFVRGVRAGAASGAGAGGGGGGGVARNTLALFTQPDLAEMVDWEAGVDFAGFAAGVVGRNTWTGGEGEGKGGEGLKGGEGRRAAHMGRR